VDQGKPSISPARPGYSTLPRNFAVTGSGLTSSKASSATTSQSGATKPSFSSSSPSPASPVRSASQKNISTTLSPSATSSGEAPRGGGSTSPSLSSGASQPSSPASGGSPAGKSPQATLASYGDRLKNLRNRTGTSTPTLPTTGPAGVSDEQLWKEGEELLRKIEVARQDKKHAEQELKNIMQRKEAAKKKMEALRVKKAETKPGASASAARSHRAHQSVRKSSYARTQANAAIVQRLGQVLSTLETLEKAITTAEDAQAKAENELIEYANDQKSREEAIHELLREMANVQARVTDLQQHANNPKVQSLATQISNNISSSITAVSSTLTMQSGQATAAVPLSRSGPSVPRAPAAPLAPSAPVPPIAPSPGSGSAAISGPPIPGGGSLLAQIRAGRQLNKIDIEALRKRRKRQSSMSISVIAQTLRAAIDMKFDEDNDDEDNDDVTENSSGEEWDDDVWDEEDCF